MTITLFSNLHFAALGPLRMHVSNIIIEPHYPTLGDSAKNVRVRGFSYDAANPVFDLYLDTEDPSYELEPAESSNMLFIGENADGTSKDPEPLFKGGIVKFADGAGLRLTKNSFDDRPIEVTEHEDISDVWETLMRKAAEYHDAPNMPTLRWLPADRVREALGVTVGGRQ